MSTELPLPLSSCSARPLLGRSSDRSLGIGNWEKGTGAELGKSRSSFCENRLQLSPMSKDFFCQLEIKHCPA